MINNYSFIESIEDQELKREVLRELAKTDLYFLCKFIMGYRDMEVRTDIHYRLCSELDANPLRYLVLIFRGAFKTSIGMVKCIQWLLNDQNAQIGIGSDVKVRADKRVWDLRDMIARNELLKELFPEIFYENPEINADLWRIDEFNIKRTERQDRGEGFSAPSVSSFGLDPLPAGSHFTHVLLDDIENDGNQNNDEQIDKLNRNMGLFFPLLRPTAPVVMLGTIYSDRGPNTIYQSRWQTYKRAVLTTDGRPTFPSVYPLSVIERMKTDISDNYVWLGQYMLKPSMRTDKFFYPFSGQQFSYVPVIDNCILRSTHKTSLADCITYITIDPGGGAGLGDAKANIDKVGVCVNAVDNSGRWCILDLFQQYYTDEQFVDLLFSLYDKWHPYSIAIEKMPHLDPYIRLAFQTRGRSIPLSELKPNRRPKSDRIRALGPLWKSIDFVNTLNVAQHISTWYTDQEHGVDDIDALAYQIDVARPPTKEMLADQRVRWEQHDEKRLVAALPQLEREEHEYWLKQKKKSFTSDQEFDNELEAFYAGESEDYYDVEYDEEG